MSLSPSFRLPPFIAPGNAHPEVIEAVNYAADGITDLNQAITSLKTQIDAKANATTTAAPSTNTTSSTESVTNVTIGGGPVNNQTGVTAYTTAQSDNGALLIFADASPVAVTLNNSVTLPWYCFVTNQGAGLVTLTPQQNTINGNASETVLQSYFAVIFFDGTNWWSSNIPIVPVNTPGVAHQWLASYNAATGAFTLSQPAFTDISGTATAGQVPALSALTGQITTSQLPSSGLTTTIVTAKLTGGGANGSMVFTNGILTASTPAT
jgi:hypothetical protein